MLNAAGVEYALGGGYAIASHGFNRFSEDIDILVNPAADNSRRWIVALGELPDHATLDLVSDPDVFATDARYALRVNDEITIDIMPSIAGHSWQEMSRHIETIDLDGVPLPLLNLEGLVAWLMGAGTTLVGDQGVTGSNPVTPTTGYSSARPACPAADMNRARAPELERAPSLLEACFAL